MFLSHLGSPENDIKDLCTVTELGGYHYLVKCLLIIQMEITYLFHSGTIIGLVLILQLPVVFSVQPSISFFEKMI